MESSCKNQLLRAISNAYRFLAVRNAFGDFVGCGVQVVSPSLCSIAKPWVGKGCRDFFAIMF